MRYFHNLYGIFQLSNTLAATVGFDIGIEQEKKGSSAMNTWFNPTVILQVCSHSKKRFCCKRGVLRRQKWGDHWLWYSEWF